MANNGHHKMVMILPNRQIDEINNSALRLPRSKLLANQKQNKVYNLIAITIKQLVLDTLFKHFNCKPSSKSINIHILSTQFRLLTYRLKYQYIQHNTEFYTFFPTTCSACIFTFSSLCREAVISGV